MRTLKLLFVFLLLSSSLFANPLWMRYPSISPDGKMIAFSYKGDIYTVSSGGGDARQITMHEAHDYMPVWSPDSKQIVFASNRFGNFDLFLISAEGGNVSRITTFSGNEYPYSFSPDGKSILYGANIQLPAESAAFPYRPFNELYKISIHGGRPEQLLATHAENISMSKDGNRMIYQNKTGIENQWRKHHTSSVTRDIMMYDFSQNKFTHLINNPGEDTNPVWSPDNTTVYFLSERSGSFNVYSFPIENPLEVKQETNFKTHPIRFLSIAQTGTLCFGYDGEIYVKGNTSKPNKVKINIAEENKKNDSSPIRGGGASAVSADGKQVASVVRGEIFVSSTEYKYTKRITNSAEQDNSPNFSPDGKTLIYASEKSGMWNLYKATIEREEENYFFNATLVKEELLLNDASKERMYPKYSPDGKEIAFIEDRKKLMVYNLETKKTRMITDGSYHPGTTGRISYQWSPDSKWFTLTYTANKHDPYTDIGLVSAEGGEITNLTNSGYTDRNPKFVLEGNAILFSSERYGMRNHASWGSLDDVMIVFLNQKAYDKYRLSEDDYKLLQEEEKLNKKKNDDAKKDKEDDKDDKEKKDENKDILVELKNIEDRIIRITPHSSNLGDAMLNKDGDKLYYLASFESGYDLWSINTRSRETKLEIKNAGNGSLQLDKEGKTLFMLGGNPQKITLAGNKKESIAVSAQFDMDLASERKYMFNHVWTEEQKRFYVKSMHGVDWDLMKKTYEKFLPYINNNFDLAEMLSEMLGELNVSHTGSSFSGGRTNSDETASLGILFSWKYEKDGLLIDEILEKGPLDKDNSKAKKGIIIEKINGEKIELGKDFFPFLNKVAGKNTLLSFFDPETGERWEEVIKPITYGAQNSLLYNRWIKQREAEVERVSKGRLGYVHIQSMNDPSFRTVYSDILGKYNDKEGIVIDTRFNGGGRLHEDIETLFSGKKYFTQVVRDVEACDMPSRRWNKASIMIIGEANYSNAHGTPWVYKHNGIGKLVGMPVPGTMTSVNWETLQDPTMLFGIPVTGYKLSDGSYLENKQLEPDYKIANDPQILTKGRDQQIEKAVELLLNDL
ncbi:peptidase S41 [Bacteroidales bacterium OttesenSCG-928-M11]|nr:peptidase S41 [Bacteroidales bacterium OttesenSCG-928-M11]